jgi:hypothetical protein
MVDPPEEGVISDKMLLERLCKAPQKITCYISDTTKTYVAHVLGLVKSYWPKANLNPLADGMSADCSEEKFLEFVEELKLVAHKLVDSLEQERETMVKPLNSLSSYE